MFVQHTLSLTHTGFWRASALASVSLDLPLRVSFVYGLLLTELLMQYRSLCQTSVCERQSEHVLAYTLPRIRSSPVPQYATTLPLKCPQPQSHLSYRPTTKHLQVFFHASSTNKPICPVQTWSNIYSKVFNPNYNSFKPSRALEQSPKSTTPC